MPNKFAKGVPCLSVKDCPAAILYYCDVLGFQKDFDDAVLGRDVTLFAGVSRDEFALTLNQHPPYVGPLIVGCDVDDVDQLCEEFRARGVKILLPPQDEPWGERHMAIEDLEGHELHFSSRIGAAG